MNFFFKQSKEKSEKFKIKTESPKAQELMEKPLYSRVCNQSLFWPWTKITGSTQWKMTQFRVAKNLLNHCAHKKFK